MIETHASLSCKGVQTQCACKVESDHVETKKTRRTTHATSEDAIQLGTILCMETEDDGWVEGPVVRLERQRRTPGERKNRTRYVIQTSETEGYHIGGPKSAAQLKDLNWWIVRETEFQGNEDEEHASDGGSDTDTTEPGAKSDGPEPQGEGERGFVKRGRQGEGIIVSRYLPQMPPERTQGNRLP